MSAVDEKLPLLVSFSAEQKDAIRHVVKTGLEKPRSVLRLMKTAESVSKRKLGKDKSKPPPTPGQVLGGCCFGETLDAISHKEMVELVPGCYAVVPRVLAHMVNFLDSHRHVEGIFRISGTNRRLKILRNTVCTQPIVEDSSRPVSPHDVACLLKHFFRDIPGLLLTKDCLHDMMATADRLEGDDERLAEALLDLCLLLPELNLSTLRYTAIFFNRIAGDCDRNKMPIDNLACVLTPNLMGPSGPGVVLTRQTKIVSLLLTHACHIGVVTKDKQAAAHIVLAERAAGSRQTKSHKKWRTSEGSAQDRRPLGTINNFVSSLASKISHSRRSSATPHVSRHRSWTRSGSCHNSPLGGRDPYCRNTHSTSCLVDDTESGSAAAKLYESSVIPVSRGKRRAPTPNHELSPPPKKHAETPTRRRVLESTRVTRARAATLAKASLSAPVGCALHRQSQPLTHAEISSSAPSTGICADIDELPLGLDHSQYSRSREADNHGKPLDRLSVTRVACRRATTGTTKRGLQELESGDSLSYCSYFSGSGCLTDEGGDGGGCHVSCGSGCSHGDSDHDLGIQKSSSLTSSVLHTSGRIIGRSLKLPCPSENCTALDVSDISIHLPSIAGDGPDDYPLSPSVVTASGQSCV